MAVGIQVISGGLMIAGCIFFVIGVESRMGLGFRCRVAAWGKR